MKWSHAALSLMMLVSQAIAQPATVPFLPNFQANYYIYWHGMRVGYSEFALKKLDHDRYHLTQNAKPLLPLIPYSQHDHSIFLLKGDTIYPEVYEFHSKEPGKQREGKLTFDWKAKKMFGHTNGKSWEATITAGTQDKLSYVPFLRYQLLLHPEQTEFSFNVVSQDKIKTYHFKRVGEAIIKSKLGPTQTIIMESERPRRKRKTTLWLAPSMQYALVQLIDTRKGKVNAKVVLADYKREL